MTPFLANGAQPTFQVDGVSLAAGIPTLGEWGLLALVGLLGLAGFATLRPR